MYTLTPSAVLPVALLQRCGLAADPVPTAPVHPAEPETIREDLVARIRAEIALGIYDTDEKLQIAFDRMLDDVQ
jgi:hypothetical protein